MSQRQARYRPTRKRAPTLHELTSEASLQEAQRQAAALFDYWYWHVPDSRQMHPGLPDTIFLGPRTAPHPLLLFCENKTEAARPTVEQQAVLDCLRRVEHLEARLVRPSTWEDTLHILLHKRRP